MFLDRVKIKIKAGDGGNGAVSFLRTKLSMNGGPNGGNGGKGGDIVFVASRNVDTLYGFTFKKKFFAENGLNGNKENKNGSDGKGITIEVPCGTVIYDSETNKVIADLTEDGQKFVALKGGYGGKGNAYFATPTRQAPRFSQSGEKTKERFVTLELKVIADVGLVGYPNVGKSTLLSVISNAQPKIANYHFTTLNPMLGVVNYYDNNFVVADIPGLIEGASEGVGLGHNFLKHIERVRLILHLVDISECEYRSAIEDYNKINLELKNYSEKLASLPQILVFSKCDLLTPEELEQKINEFKKITSSDYVCISSITHKGIDELKKVVFERLKTIPKAQAIEVEDDNFDKKDKTSIEIIKHNQNFYEVAGGYIDNLIRGIVLSDEVSNAYFQNKLKTSGIIDMLKEKGMKDGDTVKIADIEFDYTE